MSWEHRRSQLTSRPDVTIGMLEALSTCADILGPGGGGDL
jgi:hypothetical protein